MKSFAEIDIANNGEYIELLTAVAKLSALFSDNAVPYINYRLAENIFCKSFAAGNLSRSDTAFDADYNTIGVGLKTFICRSNVSMEKVAEFNSLAPTFKLLEAKELALTLAKHRNERIQLAKRVYNINESLYHIVARREHQLLLFETDYNCIDIDNIRITKKSLQSLQFNDGKNYYSFNHSKSTLFRQFEVPSNAFKIDIDIIDNPYDLLRNAFTDTKLSGQAKPFVKGIDYIILPLYSTGSKTKEIPDRSGINQWNAGGRKRDFGELYIPVPSEIHKQFPDFFPGRDTPFELKVPSGELLDAKLCQQGSKALMSNPNKALSDWLLRKVLHLEEGELATRQKLDALGFDSVMIIKENESTYKIDIARTDSYENFIHGE